MKITDGGGLECENEEIEVLRIPFSKALDMIKTKRFKMQKQLYYCNMHK